MRVVPVIDLLNGSVVRGVAGRRSEYRPIQSRIAADPAPQSIARAFVEQFGFKTVYVADLDAIEGRSPNVEAWATIRGCGLKMWVDAGVGTAESYSKVRELLESRNIEAKIIIGLECWKDPDDDAWLVERARSQAVIFSLDLKNGQPIHRINQWRNRSAIEIANSAHAKGFFDIIVLDLADVGVSQGPQTLPLCKQMIAELHPVRVIAGGGVRGIADLEALSDAGCDAALVASALHDGRLTPDDIRHIQNRPR
jgi:phosphoribosylformimino-5-aminoimidazole carboxamide ribotide isomerase